jgi:hypothetical protein
MLVKLSQRVADCLQRAAECRKRAESASDPDFRRSFLAIERRWIALANSFDFEDRLAAACRH